MTLAFVTNDGAIEAANAAFVELAQELSATVQESSIDDAVLRGLLALNGGER